MDNLYEYLRLILTEARITVSMTDFLTYIYPLYTYSPNENVKIQVIKMLDIKTERLRSIRSSLEFKTTLRTKVFI